MIITTDTPKCECANVLVSFETWGSVSQIMSTFVCFPSGCVFVCLWERARLLLSDVAHQQECKPIVTGMEEQPAE